jgi:glucose/arabinose dehydrogenase
LLGLIPGKRHAAQGPREGGVSSALLRSAQRVALAVLAVVAALLLWYVANPESVRRVLVRALAKDYDDVQPTGVRGPVFAGADASRKRIEVRLEKIAEGIEQPTAIEFPPGVEDYAVVLSKTGQARWLKLDNGMYGPLFSVEVLTAVEEGLLGLAFHPDFAHNGRFFIDYVTASDGKDMSRVAEWRLTNTDDFKHAKASPVGVLLELQQPYQNHNAGQLAFGADGDLYIGFGDGGFRDDPHGNAQNPMTWLGSMLRIDVDHKDPPRAYRVPPDNPFVGKPGYQPETWAFGLRNPWRYSFDPVGRLVVADIGQDHWEEIDLVQAGDNLGWNAREGYACYVGAPASCARTDFVDPIYVYGRGDGNCITGGYVYTGTRIPELRGLYVFGDFGSGRLFAIELPRDRRERVKEARSLGDWPLMPSTFGRDAHGEIYVANYVGGEIYRLAPAR